MNPFKKIKAYFQITNAINKAENCHAADGDVYYVLPGINGQLLVTDRKHFKILKKKGYINKRRTMLDVKKGCFYRTSGTSLDPLTKQEASFRRSKFYQWKGC